MRGDGERKRPIPAGDLLDDHRDRHGIELRSAQFLRHCHAEQAQLAELRDGVAGKPLLAIPFEGVGLDLAHAEVPHHLDQLPVAVVRLELHPFSLPYTGVTLRRFGERGRSRCA